MTAGLPALQLSLTPASFDRGVRQGGDADDLRDLLTVLLGSPVPDAWQSAIAGWQEGIPGMKPGGIRRLNIPYAWAYGEGGRPPQIPPKADLVFEVKLLGWQK